MNDWDDWSADLYEAAVDFTAGRLALNQVRARIHSLLNVAAQVDPERVRPDREGWTSVTLMAGQETLRISRREGRIWVESQVGFRVPDEEDDDV